MTHRPQLFTSSICSAPYLAVSLLGTSLLGGCAEMHIESAAEALPLSSRNAETFNYADDCQSVANLAWDESTGQGRPYLLEPAPLKSAADGDASELTACEAVGEISRVEKTVMWRHPAARVTIELPGAADCAATVCDPQAPGCPAAAPVCAGVDDVVLHLFTSTAVNLPCPEQVVFETSANGVDFAEIARLDGDLCVHDGPKGDNDETKDWLIFASDDPNAVLDDVGAGWVRVTARHQLDRAAGFTFSELMVMGTETGAIAHHEPQDPQAIAELAGPGGWLAHVVSPWSDLDPHAPFPPSPADLITAPVFQQGTRLRTLAVVNASGAPLTLTPSVSAPTGGPTSFAGTIELALVVPQHTARFEHRADTIIPIGPQGASSMEIPDGEIRHLLIRVDAGSTPPSGHQATITLDDGQGHSQLVDLQIPVLPTELPSATETGFSFYDYPDNVGDPDCDYDWLDERAAYRNASGLTAAYTMTAGWYDTNDNGEVDPEEVDASVANVLDEIDRYPEINRLIIKLRAHRTDYNQAAVIHGFGSPEWSEAYGDWITGLVTEIDAHGFDLDKLVFEVVDEARTDVEAEYKWAGTSNWATTAEVLLTVATAIHDAGSQLDPPLSLKVMANPVLPASSEDLCASVDALECLVGQVDIWMPGFTQLDDPLDEVDVDPNDKGTFYASRRGLEELWAYNGPTWSSYQRPYDKRLMPWTLFAAGVTGYGAWNIYDPATSDPTCDPAVPDCSYLAEPVSLSTAWHALDGTRTDYATTYRNGACDPNAPDEAWVETPIFASMRVAGFEQGLEDYRILTALRDALEQCGALPVCANGCTAFGPAEQALNDGWRAVLSDREDTSQADTVRLDLRGHLDGLQACLP